MMCKIGELPFKVSAQYLMLQLLVLILTSKVMKVKESEHQNSVCIQIPEQFITLNLQNSTKTPKGAGL